MIWIRPNACQQSTFDNRGVGVGVPLTGSCSPCRNNMLLLFVCDAFQKWEWRQPKQLLTMLLRCGAACWGCWWVACCLDSDESDLCSVCADSVPPRTVERHATPKQFCHPTTSPAEYLWQTADTPSSSPLFCFHIHLGSAQHPTNPATSGGGSLYTHAEWMNSLQPAKKTKMKWLISFDLCLSCLTSTQHTRTWFFQGSVI